MTLCPLSFFILKGQVSVIDPYPHTVFFEFLGNSVCDCHRPVMTARAAKRYIKMILPLHGYVWRNSLDVITGLYLKWASYTPEKNSAAVFYGSIYGNTANAAEILAGKLADRGLTDVRVYDVSKTDISYLLTAAFEYSALVFASVTYNGEVFGRMQELLNDMKNHNLSNRTVGIIENGSWASTSGAKMAELISGMKDMNIVEQ